MWSWCVYQMWSCIVSKNYNILFVIQKLGSAISHSHILLARTCFTMGEKLIYNTTLISGIDIGFYFKLSFSCTGVMCI